MREIKFRAWDNKHNKMISWEEIEDMDDGYGYYWLFAYKPQYKHEDWIAMQYTGLKDKNGKEIFEGDVLLPWHKNGRGNWNPAHKRRRVVEWKSTNQNNGIPRIGFNLTDCGTYEVIGNIYENPELIK